MSLKILSLTNLVCKITRRIVYISYVRAINQRVKNEI